MLFELRAQQPLLILAAFCHYTYALMRPLPLGQVDIARPIISPSVAKADFLNLGRDLRAAVDGEMISLIIFVGLIRLIASDCTLPSFLNPEEKPKHLGTGLTSIKDRRCGEGDDA